MTQQRYDSGEIPVNVAGAHAANTLMMWSSAGQNVVVATAATSNNTKIMGHLTKASTGAGRATLRLLSSPGTHIGIADGAITENDPVTAAAAGAVESDGAGILLGYALETVADGESVMYRPINGMVASA